MRERERGVFGVARRGNRHAANKSFSRVRRQRGWFFGERERERDSFFLFFFEDQLRKNFGFVKKRRK